MDDLDALEQSKRDKRAALAKWRQAQLHEWSLPSGLPVVTHDASIMDLAFSGQIPEPFMALIMSQAEKQGAVDLGQFKEFAEFGKLIEELVKLCLVEPAIGAVADDDHITLAELSYTDRMAIFNWANREVAALETFREQPGEPVPAAQPG
jgi:hypothetical protein